jgi:amino-acid N-acetyltransferase
VKQAHERRGYGIELVKHAESVAKARSIPRVFALSNRAADFFIKHLGYSEATPEVLTAARRKQYEDSGRDSRILSRELV